MQDMSFWLYQVFKHLFTDPFGRPTATAGSDHIFARVVCTCVLPSARPSPLFKISQNKTKFKWE